MALVDALTRIAEIEVFAGRVTPGAGGRPIAPDLFAAALASAAPASSLEAAWPTFPAGDGQAGLRALAAAAAELGVSETPPGSNDGERIAVYRTATVGASPGVPWCAYFVSWAAAQAGAPLGEQGQGFASVAQIASWAARSGRLVPDGEPPRPGDLILFGGRHVGIVEAVGPGDELTTIEGNSANRVARRQHTVGEATGFVRL